MPSTKLRELQEKLYAKQSMMDTIFAQAKQPDGRFDFLQAEAFQHLDNQKACLESLDALEKELVDCNAEMETQAKLEETEARLKERRAAMQKVTEPMVHAQGNGQGTGQAQRKSLAELVTQHYPRDVANRVSDTVIFQKEFRDVDLKALMSYSASPGFPPEATRIPRLAEFAHRPVQVTDLFPVGNTDQYQIIFMRETVSTNAAVEIGEGLTMAASEATLTYAAITVNIRKLVVHIPATEEQLADVQQVAGLIDARLRFFLQQKLDSQLLVGAASGVEITGILNSSPTALDRGTDPQPDAIYRGLVSVRVTGRARPDAVLMHPNDLADMRLLRSADGFYIWGHPSIPGPMTVFGVPIVETDALTENTTLVGDFAGHSQLWIRQGIEVMTGYRTDDFIKGIQTIRMTMRAGLAVYRSAAFAAITSM